LVALLSRSCERRAIVAAVNGVLAGAGLEVEDVAVRSHHLAQLLGCRTATAEHLAVARRLARSRSGDISPAPWSPTVTLAPLTRSRAVLGVAAVALIPPRVAWGPADAALVQAAAMVLAAHADRVRLLDAVHRFQDEMATAAARQRALRGATVSARLVLQDVRADLDAALADGGPDLGGLLSLARARVETGQYELQAAEREARLASLAGIPLHVSLRQLAAWFQHEVDVPVAVDIPWMAVDLVPQVEAALLRVACEALWTLQQGSRSSVVCLSLVAARDVALTLRDDGVPLTQRMGTSPGANPFGGLRAIRDSAASIGARATCVAATPRGIELTVCVPQPSRRAEINPLIE
jgi:signal transduction histidine kinase